MLKGMGRGSFFEGGEYEAGADSQSLQPLAHELFKQFTGSRPTSRVRIEHSHGRRADGPSLQNRSILFDHRNYYFQIRLRNNKRRAFDGAHSLADAGVGRVGRGGDGHADRVVDLPQKVVIYQHATLLSRENVRPPTGRQLDGE